MPKRRKVEEPSAPYVAGKQPARRPTAPAEKKPGAAIRFLDDGPAEKLTDKVFAERKKLLHKLAQ